MLGYLVILLLGVIVVAAIATFLVGTFLKYLAGKGPHKPYRRAESLLPQEQLIAYAALVQACEGWAIVQCKVRLWDLLWVPKDTRKPEMWRDRVWHKYADMVVCRTADLKPLAVVAVALPNAAPRLNELREVLRAAGIPMIALEPASSFNPDEIRERLRRAIAENPNVPAADVALAQITTA